MRQSFTIKYWILIFILGFASCSDYFSPELDTLLPEEESFKDYLSSRAAVNGLYTGLQDLMTSYVVTGELRGDMLMPTSSADQDLIDIYQLKITADNTYLSYREYYTLIASCNDVEAQLTKLREKGTTYDEALDNMYGETLLLRSWAYFYLLRNFTENPYITAAYSSADADVPYTDWLNQQTSELLTAGTIIQDIEKAIPLLDADNISSSGFFHLASAYAFLGEVYLWENQYDEAISALHKSIDSGNGGRFILDKDLENAKWQNIFKGDESATDEIMTKVIFDKGEKQENGLMPIFSGAAPAGNQLIPVSFITQSLQGTHRFGGTFTNNLEVKKYTRSVDDAYTSDMPVILYRAADVHLMLAEAYNRISEPETALDLLNTGSDSLFTAGSKGIRGRVAQAALKITSTEPGEILLELEDMILEERGRELAFEGKRWYDLVRIARRRNDPSYLVNKIIRRFDAPDTLAIEQFFLNEDNWYFPSKN